MRKAKQILFLVLIVVFVAGNHQIYAQNNQNVIEIISLNLPDSVVFKFSKGEAEKFKFAVVTLANRKKFDQPKETITTPALNISTQNGIIGTLTDETVVRALGFNKSFKAKKLQFALMSSLNGQMIFVNYDIEKKKWE